MREAHCGYTSLHDYVITIQYRIMFFVNFRSVVHNPKFVFVQVQLISNNFVIALFYFLLNIKSCKWEIKERREGPELHRN